MKIFVSANSMQSKSPVPCTHSLKHGFITVHSCLWHMRYCMAHLVLVLRNPKHITYISHICMIVIRCYTCDIHVHDCSMRISFPTVVYFWMLRSCVWQCWNTPVFSFVLPLSSSLRLRAVSIKEMIYRSIYIYSVDIECIYIKGEMCININFHVMYNIFVPQSIRICSCTLEVSCKIYVERQRKMATTGASLG